MSRGSLALIALLLVGACAGASNADPEDLFRLVAVDGRPLPVSYPEEQGCREEIFGAALSLEADGEWEMTMSKREVCGDAEEVDEDVEEGAYTTDGRTYRFTSPQGDAAAPSPGEIEIENLLEGTLDGDSLTVRLGDGTTAVFRRP